MRVVLKGKVFKRDDGLWCAEITDELGVVRSTVIAADHSLVLRESLERLRPEYFEEMFGQSYWDWYRGLDDGAKERAVKFRASAGI